MVNKAKAKVRYTFTQCLVACDDKSHAPRTRVAMPPYCFRDSRKLMVGDRVRVTVELLERQARERR